MNHSVAGARRGRGRGAGWFIVAAAVAIVLAVVIVSFAALTRPDADEPESPSAQSPAGSVLLLQRSPADEPDRIVQSVVSDDGIGEPQTVYTADRILDFAEAGDVLAVLTESVPGEHSLSLLSDGVEVPVTLPGVGTVDHLQVAADGVVGFRFTGVPRDPARGGLQGVYLVDPSTAVAPLMLRAPDGAPFASDWASVPHSSDLLLLHEGHLLRWDPRGDAAPVEVGHTDGHGDGASDTDEDHASEDHAHESHGAHDHGWDSIEAVAEDGSAVVVRDHHDTVLVSLADGSEQVLVPSPIHGVQPFGGQVVLSDGAGSLIRKVTLVDAATNLFSTLVVVDDGSEAGVLIDTTGTDVAVDDIRLSPDGALLAVEVTPSLSESTPDGYYPFSRATTVLTLVIDVDTGAEVGRIEGFGMLW